MSRALARRLAAVLLLVLVSSTSASARGLFVSGGAGASLPTGGFADARQAHARGGWQVAGALDWSLAAPWSVGFDGSLNHNVHGEEGRTQDLGGGAVYTLEEDRFKTWQIGVHATRWIAPGRGSLHPYASLGLGVYSTREDYTESVTSLGGVARTSVQGEGDPRVGGRLGLGAAWSVTPAFGFALEGNFHLVPMDESRAGFSTLRYLGLHGGVRFSVPVPR